jgi:hypothetical protein
MPKFAVVMSSYKTVNVEADSDIEAMAKADQQCKNDKLTWFPDFAEEVVNGKATS